MGLGIPEKIGFGLIVACVWGIFVLRGQENQQLRLLFFAGMYVGVGLIYRLTLSFQSVFAFVLTGVMCAVVLGTDRFPFVLNLTVRMPRSLILLRLLIAAVFTVILWLMLPSVASLLPLRRVVLFSGMTVFLFGLLTFGLGTQMIDRFLGLLCLLLSFQLIYIALEDSLIVFGVLLFFQLIVAFFGSLFGGASFAAGEETFGTDTGGKAEVIE